MFDDLCQFGHSDAVQWARDNQEKLFGLAKMNLNIKIFDDSFEIVRDLNNVVYCKTDIADHAYIIGYLDIVNNTLEFKTYTSYISGRRPKCIEINGKEFNNFGNNEEIIFSALNYIKTILSIGELEGDDEG
jgi:hypothetical protein